MFRKSFLVVFFLFFCFLGYAQRKEVTQNYSRFDRRTVHFGFMLGVNTADFSTLYEPNLLENYGLYSIENTRQPGFQLGIISSLKLWHPSLRLRFIPSLSFLERVLDYNYLEDDGSFSVHEERTGSTNLDFPLLLKLRTARYNNFASYVVAGMQYTLDLQTKEFSAQQPANPFLKIKRDDFQGQVGAGVDFFLPYFKFGMELKLSHSVINALVQDNTRLSSPIDRLSNRVWWISFTFEG